MNSLTISRRPASESDRSLLYRLFASIREPELQMLPWTDEQKQAFIEMQFSAQTDGYRNTHPGAQHEIICADGEPAGRIYWSRLPERIHILDITVATEKRNAGIGTAVLREIFEEADRASLPVTIYLESYNPSQSLFRRLGFGIAADEGVHLLFERPAASASAKISTV
jgi:ribosomal protein S18 acetylase RimI-like enzyme